MSLKLWGGAFSEQPADLAFRFGQSVHSDLTLFDEEIVVSAAHAKMLHQAGLLEGTELAEIERSLAFLKTQRQDIAVSPMLADTEDIHELIENLLFGLIGDTAKKLHAGRSRNDQIATVTRLWLKRTAANLLAEVTKAQAVLLELAEKHAKDPMPGHTHQQPAQPITLGFRFLAYFWMLDRDAKRFAGVIESANECPMGSAALAGTSLPIDREFMSTGLGFCQPIPNALDATSDRDFIGDALHACSMLMQHLSRIAQEIVLFSTAEFGYWELDEAYRTGSSIMPQKRNPDMAELIRGRSAKVIGHWTSFMSMMKALPLGYNRDQQDDKPPIYEAMNLCSDSVGLVREMLATASFDMAKMRNQAEANFACATYIAEQLVLQGVPFRTAHERVGMWVKAQIQGQPCGDDFASQFDLSVESVLASQESEGGTGAGAIAAQIELAKRQSAAVDRACVVQETDQAVAISRES